MCYSQRLLHAQLASGPYLKNMMIDTNRPGLYMNALYQVAHHGIVMLFGQVKSGRCTYSIADLPILS